MNDLPFYGVGNLTADPELGTTPGGTPYARIRIAITPRHRKGDSYVDGTTSFVPAVVWNDQALNVVKSLAKSVRVVATGRWETNTYTPTDGDRAGKETSRLEVVIDEIGPTLRFATAEVTKVKRSDRSAA